jgi:hypothetical protein
MESKVKITVKIGGNEVNISFPIETTKTTDRFEKIINKSIDAISEIMDRFEKKEDDPK